MDVYDHCSRLLCSVSHKSTAFFKTPCQVRAVHTECEKRFSVPVRYFYIVFLHKHTRLTCWPLRLCLAHEHCIFKMQNFNFYTQCYSSISVPKQWTNQKTPEAGQAFVYSSKLATVLFGGKLVLHFYLFVFFPFLSTASHILVAKMRSL